MEWLLMGGLVLAFVTVVRINAKLLELKDLVLWYRRALAQQGIRWQQVEVTRLVLYRHDPGLRSGGAHRDCQGPSGMEFVTPRQAAAASLAIDEAYRLARIEDGKRV